jgi:hypothetical protein
MTSTTEISPRHQEMLAHIRDAEEALTKRFSQRMQVNDDLDRTLVSFQANKSEIGHRWCKYREGFSAELIRYVIENIGISGRILDPFAGSGTTLFVAADFGIDSLGIELLPCSAEIIEVRRSLAHTNKLKLAGDVRKFASERTWIQPGKVTPFQHLRITEGAFPSENGRQLGRFLFDSEQLSNEMLSRLLRFSALSILEDISFTRKDGQYLRWDQRAGRGFGKKAFDKGRIYSFDEAILGKLLQIAEDLDGLEKQPFLFDLNPKSTSPGNIQVQVGSCLDIIPTLEPNAFDGLITSPPYCNRYDYTRTYALELAMLNVGEEGIRRLRQAMLSCTVENKDKLDLIEKFGAQTFEKASRAFEAQQLLGLVLEYLDDCKQQGSINNPGIVRMVKNYFFEMALLIFASTNVLKPGAPFVMVNDNVRYEGAHVAVDLVLSDFAVQAGFGVEAIWVLPKGKGNSSQQMRRHGRQEIRKCVYVWRKGT